MMRPLGPSPAAGCGQAVRRLFGGTTVTSLAHRFRDWLEEPVELHLPRLPRPRAKAAFHAAASGPAPRSRPHEQPRDEPREEPLEKPPRTATDHASAARAWTTSRLATVQKLWGEGFLAPGGAERAVRLTKPLGLTPASNFLEVGSGLGGAACAIAGAFGAWVDGIEPVAELAEAGVAFVRSRDLDKKVRISFLDPASAALRPDRYDAILAMEAFSAMAAKETFLGTVAGSLRTGGCFHLTDYVLGDGTKVETIRRGWPAGAGGAVRPWRDEDLLQCLADSRLDIRIDEDASREHADEALAAWSHLCGSLRHGEMGAEQADILFTTGQCWAARICALRRGDMQLRRIFAIKV